MSETASWLQVEAAGQALLLSPADVLEVLPLMAIQPLPGASRGIEGVVLHNGAFLPVLAWRDLPDCDGPSPPPSLLVVLRRFGLPVVRVAGLLRGVWLGPGAHEVVVEFWPAWLFAGMAISALGLLALAAVWRWAK